MSLDQIKQYHNTLQIRIYTSLIIPHFLCNNNIKNIA